jgi:hypothetical protein
MLGRLRNLLTTIYSLRRNHFLVLALVFTLILVQFSFSRFASIAFAAAYEAESGTLAGGAVIATDHTGYTGTGFVGGFTDANKGNASVQLTVNAAAAGSYNVTLRYANASGLTQTLSIYVNGTKIRQTPLGNLANWDTWGTKVETLTLVAGNNTIKYKYDTTDSGNVNLDNINVVSAGATPTPTPTPTPPPASNGTYQAESAALSGGAVVAADHTGYTGTGFVGGFGDVNKGTAAVTFTVNVTSAGTYPVTLTYANASGPTQTLSLYVNGIKMTQISLPNLANWDTWGTQAQSLALNNGNNTVMYKYDTTDTGNVNLDKIFIGSMATPTPTPTATPVPTPTPTPPPASNGTYQAESAALSGGAVVATDHTGYTGTGFVGGFGDSNKGNAAVTFTVNVASAGTYPATLTYANASGPTQTLSLYVNGTKMTQISLPNLANWDTWGTQVQSLALNNGNNTVMYKYDTTDTGNVNLDKIFIGSMATPTPTPTPTPVPTPTPAPGSYGATMPYDAYEAENATYSGALVGPSTTAGSIASEASGRKAVQLTAAGQYVQFTLAKAAQGVTIRYSIPDNAAGTGVDAAISMYIGGTFFKDINLTSRYSWNYGEWGTEGGQIRWSNNPNAASTTPAHMYDEASVVLNQQYAAGTVIKLQRNAANLNFSSTANVTVDLIETEAIPSALTMPANYVSITSYGAIANDGLDDTTAINNAITAVKNSGGALLGVWIPSGTFTLNNGTKGAGYDGTGTRLYLDSGVSMKGAGMWYATLSGNYAGLFLRAGNLTLSDFKISGNDLIRDDYNGVSGVEGNATNSTLTNLWIEHTKVGFWLTNQTNAATVSGSRVRDVWADGINLHRGTSNTTVTNNSIRNSGDDGLAMWSDVFMDTNNTFSFNTVQIPTLANGIGIYGGSNNKVINNLVIDTIRSGGGISYGTNFSPPSMTGTLLIQNNMLLRTGSAHRDYGYQIGAIWAYWLNNNGKAQNLTVTVSGNTIQDSTYEGIFIEEPAPGISVTYASNTIINAGTYGVYIRGSATGSSIFNNNTVNGAPSGKFLNTSTSFTVSGSGNNW